MMKAWEQEVAALFAQARAALAEGRLTEAGLCDLEGKVRALPGQVRQRLLYLHAAMPSVRSAVIAAALHEPIPGSVTQIDPLAPELPYRTVFEAILDGWRVVHFPDQRAPFDDREIDIVGYEFILEKLEVYTDGS